MGKSATKQLQALIDKQKSLTDTETGLSADQNAFTGKERQNALDADALQKEAYAEGKPFAESLIPRVNSAGRAELSPYSQSQYAAQSDKIAQTYRNLRETGLKTLAQRGYGRAPSGYGASMTNSLNEGKASADTSNWRQSMQDTLDQGKTGLGYFTGQENIFNPTPRMATANSGASTAGSINAEAGALNNGAASQVNNLASQQRQNFNSLIGSVAGLGSMFVPGGPMAKIFAGMGTKGIAPPSSTGGGGTYGGNYTG